MACHEEKKWSFYFENISFPEAKTCQLNSSFLFIKKMTFRGMLSKDNANMLLMELNLQQTPLPSTWWPFSSYKNILEVSSVASNLY